MNNIIKDSKIPITVGVIGNRDAILTDSHKKKIEKLFNDIEEKYPNNPVTLFSQLAIGADTFVAEIFVELMENKKRQYNLIVPLPYEIDKYRKTQFKTKEQLNNFEFLLSKSERFYTLENNDNIKDKKYFYRQGGKFISDSSIILIALWDEKTNLKKENYIGGTEEIVKYRITGTFDDEIDDQIFDFNGSLISWKCKRSLKNQVPFQAKELYTNLSEILKDDSIRKTIDKIVTFNNSIKTNERKATNSIERLKQIRYIIKTETAQYKKRYDHTILVFFSLGFVFFALFEIFKHQGLLMWAFWSILAVLLFGGVTWFISTKLKNHLNYIDDRVLSETLRVQIYWNLSDINKNTADYILRIHKLEYNWVKYFLQSIYGLTYDVSKTRQESIKEIKNEWIIGQINYFKKKIKNIKNINSWLTKISFISLVIGVIGLIGIGSCKLWHPDLFNLLPSEFPFSDHFTHIFHLEHFCHIFIIIDSLFFGISAVLKTYMDKKGYMQTKSPYELSKSLFSIALNKINSVIENKNINNKTRESELDHLLFLVGKEALIETGNWYFIMKEKDPEFDIA